MAQVAGDKVMTEASALGGGAAAVATGGGGSPPSPALAPSRSKAAAARAAIGPVLQFWKAFDLDSKRLMLDTQGSTMKTEKDNSLKSRKKLAETTKSFRKLPDADKVAGLGNLLRAYQEEIDNLTRRAKYSENAFFMLYKGLYAAPDPVPSLETVNEAKSSDLEEENKRLKRELREYELEFSSLKNQDITIRKLEEQLAAMEREMDDLVHDQVDQKCQDLEAQLEAKKVEFAQQKMDLERQLDSTRGELRDAFARLDAMQSDLFALKQRTDLAKSSFTAEMEVISQEAIMIQTLQLENSQLKKQLDDLLSVGGSSLDSASLPAHDASAATIAELAQKDTSIAALRQELYRTKDEVIALKDAATDQRLAYEGKLSEARRVQNELQEQLSARPTMERFNDIMRQLRVLQQLEYNIVDEEEPSGSGTGEQSEAVSDTEKILVSRVRRLEHALKEKERQLEQMKAEQAKLQHELQRKNEIVREQATLVRNLEDNMAALESRKGSQKALLTAPGDVGTEILMDAVEDQLYDRKATDAAASKDSNAASSNTVDTKMFEIVRGQRDRFRERMKELQAEKNKLEELAKSYKTSVSRLENDNMQLYHKIRYLQSYRPGSAGGNRVQPGSRRGMADLEDGSAGADVESRYQNMYEEKMNPFAQFNKMENQQRYTNLNTVDKVLLNSARMFLGHRITRNIAFGYIVLLHFLVVATLYSFMHGCGISNA